MKIIYKNAKTILSQRSHPEPWFGTKYNMNLYRGCQHRCIYCDSRSECYRVNDFDHEIIIKKNALELLDNELSKKRVIGTIGFGAMNDPYMPLEKKEKIILRSLKIIKKHNFPIHILTKSDLVLRDIDIIKNISEKTYAAISFTITTASEKLARIVEPYSSPPAKRLEAIKKLSKEGIYTGVTMMPILPFLEDTEENISAIVKIAHFYGAKYIIPSFGMTLRDRQREYYYKELDKNFPGIKYKYIKHCKNNYSCGARKHDKLQKLFYSLCKKYSISTKIKIYKQHKKEKNKNQLKLI